MNNGVRPITFTTEMLRAVIEGRKTQTRRVMRPQPEDTRAKGKDVLKVAPYLTDVPKHGMAYYWRDRWAQWNSTKPFHCPYGQPGTPLYVKETHRLTRYEHKGEPWIQAEYRFRHVKDEGESMRVYRWGDIPVDQRARLESIKSWERWRSPRFMYRFLARVWLEVVGVRAERVQSITRDDVAAEGGPFGYTGIPRQDFAQLWDSINADRGYSWTMNPWVWVVEFGRVN